VGAIPLRWETPRASHIEIRSERSDAAKSPLTKGNELLRRFDHHATQSVAARLGPITHGGVVRGESHSGFRDNR
jgi:hypothetical protein